MYQIYTVIVEVKKKKTKISINFDHQMYLQRPQKQDSASLLAYFDQWAIIPYIQNFNNAVN